MPTPAARAAALRHLAAHLPPELAPLALDAALRLPALELDAAARAAVGAQLRARVEAAGLGYVGAAAERLVVGESSRRARSPLL
jgi:hypothetical protein